MLVPKIKVSYVLGDKSWDFRGYRGKRGFIADIVDLWVRFVFPTKMTVLQWLYIASEQVS